MSCHVTDSHWTPTDDNIPDINSDVQRRGRKHGTPAIKQEVIIISCHMAASGEKTVISPPFLMSSDWSESTLTLIGNETTRWRPPNKKWRHRWRWWPMIRRWLNLIPVDQLHVVTVGRYRCRRGLHEIIGVEDKLNKQRIWFVFMLDCLRVKMRFRYRYEFSI